MMILFVVVEGIFSSAYVKFKFVFEDAEFALDLCEIFGDAEDGGDEFHS